MPRTLFLFLSLFCCTTISAQVNLNQGLVAYYPFNGNANDASGNNNNPVFNNATLTSDRFGNPNSAYSFNGIDNYIQIPNSPSLNPSNQISICAWVKVNGFYQGTCHGNNIVMKGDQDYLAGNYFLRFDDGGYTNYQNCAISTTDINHENFYGVNTPVPVGGYNPFIQTDQWYSIVYTSDGTTSNVYVNCQLKFSAPANNINFSNQYDLFLGRLNDPTYPYWFNGVMDEVRIYNRALDTDEVKAYGDCSDNSVGNIINDYTPVLSLNTCDNKITVEDASAFNDGDTVLMIQMKGSVIDSSNTATFGTVTDYKNAGNYEFNYVKSKSGNVIELTNFLTRQYDIPDGKVQLIRVPYYQNLNVTSTLTCLPWDGSKGGVLALNVQDTLTLNADVDVSGKGFRGGQAINSNILDYQPLCGAQNYYYPNTATAMQGKGEGIAEVSDQKMSGRGPLANGGGGANTSNSGGGGGSNGTSGGQGGNQYEECTAAPNNIGGIGGSVLPYSSAQNKIFMGGGGGAGDANNPGGGFNPDGGNGGGIVIIKSNYIQSNDYSITSNGADGETCVGTTSCEEGMGGGGAGGTILLDINNFISATTPITLIGGKGADNTPHNGIYNHGPGAGGSGGVLFISNASLPGTVIPDLSGGQNGMSQNTPPVAWGATSGNAGETVFNLTIPTDTIAFKPNIDSVKIKDSATGCKSFDFNGLGYANINPITNWQWYFGDGQTANNQDTSYTYSTANTFPVKLIITDNNGCKDSTIQNVTTYQIDVDAGKDTSFCSDNTVVTTLNGSSSAGNIYAWTPATYLNDSTLLNPDATINSTTKFFLTVSNGLNCSANDSVTITVNPLPLVQTNNDTTFCAGGSAQLGATGGSTYSWSPPTGLDNAAIPNPIASPTTTTQYIVTGTNANGCSAKDTVLITINPKPAIVKSNDTLICKNTSVQLSASGGVTYSWSPPATLNDPNIANPVASPTNNTTYYVTVTDANDCSNNDSINVNIRPDPVFTVTPSSDICEDTSIQLLASGGDIYSWQPATTLNNPNISNPIATPTTTTDYSVKITETACNNSTTLNTTVTVLPLPDIQATKSNDLDCSNDASHLNATGGVTYTWSPAASLNNPNVPDPVAMPATTTQYSVKGVDANGCSNVDTITVFVTGLNRGGYLMPNAFTPNNDGLNDCYGIKYWGVILDLDFSIYNRWGQRIFHTTQPGQCWDGTFNGQLQPPDVYVYMIKAKTICDQYVFRKGTFTLIR